MNASDRDLSSPPAASPDDAPAAATAQRDAEAARERQEAEIVRLELLISRSVATRTRLLRLRRTSEVNELLAANERHLAELGKALSAVTRIPFATLDLLSAAADASPMHLDP